MNAIELVQGAMKKAEKIRPKVGGFPYLAECMREAGVLKNVWTLPAGQSTFWTSDGVISVTNSPMVSGFHEVPVFDQEALIKALRADQAGQTTFPEFLVQKAFGHFFFLPSWLVCHLSSEVNVSYA